MKPEDTLIDPDDLSLEDERIAHIIRHLNRAYQARLEQRIAAHGVSFGFWAYLRVLWKADGISQRLLSERVGLTGPTTHSVIRRMETAGLVELRPVVEGKQRRAVYLSDRGQALRHALEPLAEEVNDIALTGVSSEDTKELRRILLQIMDNLNGPD